MQQRENPTSFRSGSVNKKDDIKVELEKEQKITITHQGSAWYYEIEVDSYDDLCLRRKSKYRTPEHKKPIREALDIDTQSL